MADQNKVTSIRSDMEFSNKAMDDQTLFTAQEVMRELSTLAEKVSSLVTREQYNELYQELDFCGDRLKTEFSNLTTAVDMKAARKPELTAPAATAAPVAYDQTDAQTAVTLLNELRTKYNLMNKE